ncbi:hypothetical protein GH714_034785 [Hevea brasiliensis]|uniref:protein-serine/threonine phosphatase n=1 Tax=Hevea brasiliensis TaxID=3981 RepID=A0A6A6L5F5_HEVBR|nr:hypothetical protein GH714_034785 [Hevea brasiliensis]
MVSNTLMRIVAPCWKPSVEGDNSNRDGDVTGRADGLLWYKDSGHHVNGEFSMAVIQANNLLEDCSQLESGPISLLESGPQGTFVGIYDGHGGPEAARFVNQHLFENIKKFTSETHGMSADVINKAFLATEEAFLSLVQQQWQINPQIASVGSCCLVGIVYSGHLYIANAGDSRVVLGRLDKLAKDVKAIQLSYEHNASFESGVARKLLKAALLEAAKKREMRYSDLKKIDRGVRRHFHDDITVIVLFLDSHLIGSSSCQGPLLSIRGGGGTPGNFIT